MGHITLLSVCLTLMRRVSLACMPSFVDLGYIEVAVCVGGGGFKPVTLTPTLVRLGWAVSKIRNITQLRMRFSHHSDEIERQTWGVLKMAWHVD